MLCPNCSYQHEYDHDTQEPVNSEMDKYGDFYRLSNNINFIKPETNNSMDAYACPKCKIVFIDY